MRILPVSPIDVKLMLATAGGNPPDLAGLFQVDPFQPLMDHQSPAAVGPHVRKERQSPALPSGIQRSPDFILALYLDQIAGLKAQDLDSHI